MTFDFGKRNCYLKSIKLTKNKLIVIDSIIKLIKKSF